MSWLVGSHRSVRWLLEAEIAWNTLRFGFRGFWCDPIGRWTHGRRQFLDSFLAFWPSGSTASSPDGTFIFIVRFSGSVGGSQLFRS